MPKEPQPGTCRYFSASGGRCRVNIVGDGKVKRMEADAQRGYATDRNDWFDAVALARAYPSLAELGKPDIMGSRLLCQARGRGPGNITPEGIEKQKECDFYVE